MADNLIKFQVEIGDADRWANSSDFTNNENYLDYPIFMGKPIYTRDKKGYTVVSQKNRVVLFIRKDKDFSQGSNNIKSADPKYLSKDLLYPLKASVNGNNCANYFVTSSGENLRSNEAVYSAFRKIESTYYNVISQKNIKGVYWSWFDEIGKPKGVYCLDQSAGGGGAVDDSYTTLSEMKRLAGADSQNGNGFFLNAGVYQNGKKLTDEKIYFIISWSNTIGYCGEIKTIGLGGNIISDLRAMRQEYGKDSNNHLFILGQVQATNTGYVFVEGSQSDLRSINELLKATDENPDFPKETNPPSNLDYGDNSITVDRDPITGTPTNTLGAIEYITDFSSYKFNFCGGIDKRNTISDFFSDITEKYEIDSKQFIVKSKIHNNQFSISSNLILSDEYYSYVKVNESMVETKDFFTEIDNILNLKLKKGESGWIKSIPIENDDWSRLPMTAFAVQKDDYQEVIQLKEEKITMDSFKNYSKYSLSDFITSTNRTKYQLLFFNIEQENGEYVAVLSENKDLKVFLQEINPYITYKLKKDYNCEISFSQLRKAINLYTLELVEAYTRGHDFIQENYTSVRAKEYDENNNRLMTYNDNYFTYKYSGRNFDISKNNFVFNDGIIAAPVRECDLLLETDVTLGDTYGHNKYFIEYIKYGNNSYVDTFKVKDYLEEIDDTQYTEDDLEIITASIDLGRCEYYSPIAAKFNNGWSDCCYGTNGEFHKECVYQKLGYCPYRFTTEKHPRRIRTLAAEKSNRFNIIQELSKVFEIYPQFYIEFDDNGKILLDNEGKMKKHIFFITEKGNVNQLGFRYEKNLKDISRTIDSTALTTKLFVTDIDSELSKTGLCSIQTAEDNIAKTSYVLDFSYYTKMGILNAEAVTRDLFGIEKGDFAFLPTIGYYNTQYDKLSNLIINLTGETMTQLEAENITNIEGVTASLVEKQKISQKMYQFKVSSYKDGEYDYTTSDTYESYLIKMKEQSTILWGLVETLFFTGNYFTDIRNSKNPVSINIFDAIDHFGAPESVKDTYCNGELFWRLLIEGFENSEYKPYFSSWDEFKEKILDEYLYPINGKVGQYTDMKKQVNTWKKERAKWLNRINDISEQFYKKYEPFLKEGTWTDDNYLTDNEYYWAAVSVLNDSCQPKITYNISVVDLNSLDEDYKFDVADTSYVEDIDFFGINQKTGLPNKQKVLVSSITDDLDNPMNNSIEVKNYTSSFDELFEAISASVQSLTFNENTYKRASNFTATKYISKESLQGTLFDGDITLVDHYSENVVMDDTGVQGKNINNTSLGYKLNGEGLLFTKDNGQTWDIGVGPNGINADYIKFGQLDASKIQIVDGNYIYFLWDKNGLNAYRNPATSTSGLVDFARFNKYGLSLIENNNVRLRAGYEFKNDETRNYSGNYKTEMDLVDQNIGFYLYNDRGQAIFKTETSSDYSGEEGDYSARLSLTGEMFITNKVLEGENTGQSLNTVYVYNYSNALSINDEKIYSLTKSSEYQNYYNEYLKTKDENNIGIIIKGYELVQDVNGEFYFDVPIIMEDIEIWTNVQLLPREETVLYEKTDNGIKKVDSSMWQLYQMTYDSCYLNLSELPIEDGRFTLEEILEAIADKDKISNNGYSLYLYDESKKFEEAAIYHGTAEYALVCTAKAPNATLTTYSKDQSQYPVEYYDAVDVNIGDEIALTTHLYYSNIATINDIVYNYWHSQEYSGESFEEGFSDVETQEVGIFINNKAGLQSSDISTYSSNDISEETVSTFSLLRNGGIDIKADDFILIGDSITAGLQNIFSNAYGISSASFSNGLINPDNIPLAGKTNLAFFLGMNNMYTDESYTNDYITLIQNVANKVENLNSISVISVIAVDETINDGYKATTNEDIQKRNAAIANMVNKQINGVSIQYKDIFTLSKSFKHSDRVHLTSNGNQSLLNALIAVFNEVTLTEDLIYNPEVGEAAAEAQSGAERIFTIALKGQKGEGEETVYNNILTVLKNGYLYMGGEIRNYYGNKLNMSDFKLLPDRIRINNPQFILSNDGFMWMDWSKTYQIDSTTGNLATEKSLLEMINALGSLGSSATSGYYLIDPLS